MVAVTLCDCTAILEAAIETYIGLSLEKLRWHLKELLRRVLLIPEKMERLTKEKRFAQSRILSELKVRDLKGTASQPETYL